MVLNWRELQGLSASELMSALLAELDTSMRGLSEEEEDERLATLPAPLRVLWVLQWLDFEVTQGSLLAYFFNGPGRHARLAAQALHDIGAKRMADVIRRATESVIAASDEWVARHDELDGMPEYSVVRPYEGLSNAEQLSELTNQYWAAANEEDWGDKLVAFLSKAVADQASR